MNKMKSLEAKCTSEELLSCDRTLFINTEADMAQIATDRKSRSMVCLSLALAKPSEKFVCEMENGERIAIMRGEHFLN